jgi:DNA repair protein RadA/Sms
MKRDAGYRCTGCDTPVATWVGRCPACQGWNTLEAVAAPGRVGGAGAAGEPVRAADAAGQGMVVSPTGLAEFDRVLSGGLGPGSVTLLGGEPGIGKSTLLLQVLANAVAGGGRALYVSAEESVSQVRSRAERLDALHDELWLLAEASVERICDQVARLRPGLVVVDSIQTVATAAGGVAGSVSGVRDAASRLAAAAREAGVATVLVGHVTKDGGLAGPRQLEHLVDTVLTFEGDRYHGLRLLRCAKHRFGPTQELGLFEMSDSGLRDLPDPSGLFLADRRPDAAGSVVFPLVEGQRPLLVEVQALVVPTPAPMPRRSAEGVSSTRLALLLAVLGRRLGLGVLSAEVYALAVGGVEVADPGADLAVALAVSSALTGRPVAADTVVCGEVGLTGEVRAVRNVERRLAEAERAGFRRAIVPASAPPGPTGLQLRRVATVAEALAVAGLDVVRPLRGRAA